MHTGEICALGTRLLYSIEKKTDESLLQEECSRIERRYSRFLLESDFSRFCMEGGGMCHTEMWELFLFSKYLYEKSEGVFDITVGGILQSWGYGKRERGKSCVFSDLIWNEAKKEVFFPPGVSLDFGGFGKGFALDVCVHRTSSKQLFLNFGGDMYTRGSPRKVALQSPFIPGEAIGEVILENAFFAASSPLYRKWGSYHHLVDTRAATPGQKCAAVFVMGSSGKLCDAVATILFLDPRKEVAEKFDVEYVIVFPDGRYERSAWCGLEMYGG